ncbi:MAG TPA: hypothetical protein VH000_05810 [Rhizomicrobium sp.]|nr:hypothetical protein [Rhizomicrobium sp.]
MFAAKFLTFCTWSARLLIIPALAVVIWGELAATGGPPLGLWDKLLHFIAYFGLAGMSLVALRPGRWALWTTAALIAMGGMLEIIQGMIGRDASWGDELANTLGAVIGCALGWGIVRLLERAAGSANRS